MQNLLALPAGTELVEDYRILRVLGAGGFGLTYLAREETLDRSVTIKEYFPSDFAAREATLSVRARSVDAEEDYGWGLERFIEEAQTLARFDHPNINRVYRYFRANNTAYIVLHFEEGQSFKSWLASLGRAPRQSELDTIAAPLLDALELIHGGNYLHRDIAPDNIIIRKSGAPVLIDFGSARGEMVQLSKTVSALVKPGYSPYEQYGISGRQQGPWTDIYSLGASLYQAIAGKRPTDAPTRMVADDYRPAAQVALSSYRPQFLAAIDHALKLRVEDRPQSIAAWRRDLLSPAAAPAGKPVQDAKPMAAKRAASTGKIAPTAPLNPADAVQVPGIFKRGAAAQTPMASPAAAVPSSATAPPTTQKPGLKKRLVRILEGVAARPEAAPAPTDEPAPLRAPAPIAAASKEAAKPPARVAAMPAVIAQTPPRAPRRRWRLFARKTPPTVPDPPKLEPIKLPAAKAASVPAVITPSGARPKPERPAPMPPPRTSRSVALKLLAGAMLSALLLSYQDQIRMAWHALTPHDAQQTANKAARQQVRKTSDRKPDTRGTTASAITTSALTVPDSPISLPRPIEDIVLRGHRGAVHAVAFVTDGKALVSTGIDGTMRLWDVSKRELIRTVEEGEHPTNALAVLDRMAAVGHQDGTIALWDLDLGQRLRTFKRNDAAIWSLAFAGETRFVLSGGHDWAVARWDRQREDGPLHLFEGHDNAVQAVAYSPRTNQGAGGATALVASGGADKYVKLWNASDRSLIRTYRGHRDFVSALAFSPDGAQLASGGFDKAVKIWSTGEGSGSRTLRGHKGRVTALSFSGDGQVLASASEDGTVRLWDWKRGRVIRTLIGHSGGVRSVAFSVDGKSVVTAGDDGTIRLWDGTPIPRATASRS